MLRTITIVNISLTKICKYINHVLGVVITFDVFIIVFKSCNAPINGPFLFSSFYCFDRLFGYSSTFGHLVAK